MGLRTCDDNYKTYSCSSSEGDSDPSFSLITAGIFPVYLDQLPGEIFLGSAGSIMAPLHLQNMLLVIAHLN